MSMQDLLVHVADNIGHVADAADEPNLRDCQWLVGAVHQLSIGWIQRVSRLQYQGGKGQWLTLD